MSRGAGSEFVSFDGAEALSVARDAADGGVRVFAEVTSDDYDVRYVADAVEEKYERVNADGEEVAAQFYRYERLDFFEREAVGELVPTVDEVSAFATFTDEGIATRVINDRGEGVFVSVEPGTHVTPVVSALESVVAEG